MSRETIKTTRDSANTTDLRCITQDMAQCGRMKYSGAMMDVGE